MRDIYDVESTNDRSKAGGARVSVSRKVSSRPLLVPTLVIATIATATVVAGSWLGFRASVISTELESAFALIPALEDQLLNNDVTGANNTVNQLSVHTAAARVAATDPLWTMSADLPWLGSNFRAATEVATAADDLAQFAAIPLVGAFGTLDWTQLMPEGKGDVDLGPLSAAKPKVISAANAVRESSNRLNAIDTGGLLPQLSDPLTQARGQIEILRKSLNAAADVANVAPDMLGVAGPQHYLILIQNNAESRATGGIPGALAILTIDDGRIELGAQDSAGGLGTFTPPIRVSPEQEALYSARLGKYMQDVNLTPDFPTTAGVAREMWERKTGQLVDGVISLDPVALGYVLDATGPVQLTTPELVTLAKSGLPTEISGENVVKTMLSDVYAKIEPSGLQDVYFAGVAKEIFASLSAGNGEAKALVKGIARGTEEGRVLVWSGQTDLQGILSKYPLSGSISGPGVAPAQFGVYFNDGTGAKMDYYVKRTVRLVKKCDMDGYEQITVRVTSINTAPADAATSLPRYVTAGGIYGVPAGSVRTNVIAYGPAQANVETATVDGTKTDFAAHRHANRPVGAVTVTLAPGQSSTVELTFGKIVQHMEPNVVVTPTVQPVKDVILATQYEACN